MKKLKLILIFFIVSSSIIGCNKTSSNIKNYLHTGTKIDTNSIGIMPKLSSLPKYESVDYRYTHISHYIFESDSVVLAVKYDKDTYKREKELLFENYPFLNRKIKFGFDDNKYCIPENEFSINSFKFKVIDKSSNDNTQFPKSFGIIGTSDKKNSIAYLYFYDFDIDYIYNKDEKSAMANFVKKYFKYDF